MATVFSWEGGTLPTVVGDVSLDSGFGIPTQPSILVGDGEGAAGVRWDHDPVDEMAVRFYVRTPSAWGSSACNILGLRPTNSGLAAAIAFAGTGQPGQLRLVRTGGSQTASSSAGLMETSSLYRIEIRYDSINQRARLAIWSFEGSNTPLWDSGWQTHSDYGSAIIRSDIGRIQSNPLIEYSLDSILAADSSDSLPRHAGDAEGGEPEPDPVLPITWDTGPLPEVTVGPISLDTEEGIPLPSSLLVPSESGAAFAHWVFPAEEKVSTRFYFSTPASWASSSYNVLSLREDSTTTIANINISGMGNPGQFRLAKAGGVIVGNSTSILENNKNYRAELQYDATGTRCRTALFDMGQNDPLWDSGWIIDEVWDVTATEMAVGRPNNSPSTFEYRVDSIRIQEGATGTWIGRHSTDEEEDPPPASPDFPIVWDSGDLPDIVSGNVNLNASWGYPSAPSIQIDQMASSTAFVEFSHDSYPREIAVRAYCRLPSSWASSAWGLLNIYNANDSFAILTISGAGQPGQIRLGATGGATVLSSPNNTLTAGALYRFEIRVDTVTGLARAAAFSQGFEAAVWDSGWLFNANFLQDRITRTRIGRVTVNPTAPGFTVDSIRIVDSSVTWVGLSEGDLPSPASVKVWNGSSLVTPTGIKVWNGSTLVPVSITYTKG